MNIKGKGLISFFIVVIPLSLFLIATFFITTFYIDKIELYFQKAKENSIKEYINSQKKESEMWVNQLGMLFEYKYNKIDKQIKDELILRVNTACESAKYIYDKYKNKKYSKEIKERIKDSLSQLIFDGSRGKIFITDYYTNSILPGDQRISNKNITNYMDADGRNIVLEEIQKVRRRGGGFIKSRHYDDNLTQLIYVKNLNIYNWFIGSCIYKEEKVKALKNSLLDMMKTIPLNNKDFLALYEDKNLLYISNDKDSKQASLKKIAKYLSKSNRWNEDVVDGYYYYSRYIKELNWYVVYGFDISKISKKELEKQQELEAMLNKELDFIIKAAVAMVIVVMVMSLLLSRKINKIFLKYQKELKQRADELETLNESLEQKVCDELEARREKEKLLIQQSKMAEMGDMLSMIAHQWRQPLNQMSYLFMNLESAYEYGELTKEYLDEKIEEGTLLLEFMSVTIDEFRNYFRPDKEKEFALVSNLVKTSVTLIQKSLDDNGIKIELNSYGRELTHIYKNEFIQVILNLIKNAKDNLVEHNIANPKISITSKCQSDKLIVEVCDNGTGVDKEIIDKIFDPYFSTKDNQNGTGVGLYMSKMIIEGHLGGKLSVYNLDSAGACFRIEI